MIGPSRRSPSSACWRSSRGADWAATRSPSALDRAFEVGPRVWLTTCTLDGPNALPNYLKRGMEVFRQEERPWSG